MTRGGLYNSEIIKEHADRLGEKALADKIGTYPKIVKRLIAGENTTIKMLHRVAAALEMPVCRLIDPHCYVRRAR